MDWSNATVIQHDCTVKQRIYKNWIRDKQGSRPLDFTEGFYQTYILFESQLELTC